jgi:glycosyltransferase involved in cell wall biosynthesis
VKISLLSTFFPFRGGIAQFNATLAKELSKNHEVNATTFTNQYPSFLFPGKSQLVEEGEKAEDFPAVRKLNTINPISYWMTGKWIKKQAPDLFITKYWMTFFGPSLGFVAKMLRKKTKRISILDNVIPHERRFFDNFANKFFLKHNDGFIVMSDAVQRDLLSLKPDAKFLRINHPVFDHFGDIIPQKTALATLKLDTTRRTILFFGFIRDYKGLDVLLEAMQFLDTSYQLIVAGEVYGDFSKYQRIIDASPAKSRIHLFTDYINDNQVPTFFCAADVCILPYKTATQSGITAIAQHFEIPVIATDVGGLKEVITHGKTGLIVQKPEPSLVSASISHFFYNNFKEKMQANIKAEKAENSWENFALKLLAFAETIKK